MSGRDTNRIRLRVALFLLGGCTEESQPESLGTRIRLARLKARLSQAQLAEKVFVAQQCSISEWELDKRVPSYETLERIAIATGADVEYFMEALR